MNLSNTEPVNCPLCADRSSQIKYVINSWKIVECTACSFVYVNPRLKKNELLNLYTSNYFDNNEVGYYHYTENKTLRKRNFKKWVGDAASYVMQNSTIKALDVGCAAGYCLEVFKELNWEPYGIELDKKIAGELTQTGFKVFDQPLVQLKTNERFGFISIFDVIEHLTDLHDNMAMLNSLLADGGILVIVTPNYASWQRRLFRRKWFQFKPIEHINYFSPDTLKKLAAENCFDVLQIKKSGQFCDTDFLKNRLKKYRFSWAIPIFNLVVKLMGLKEKYFYADTASLYAILKKRQTV